MNAVLEQAPGAQQPDVLALADSIARILTRGSRVVLLTHSQGNLYAQQALTRLSLGPLAGRLGCVGVVGVAPPTSVGWPVAASSVEQMIAVGTFSSDILWQLSTIANRAVHVRTALTDSYDRLAFLLFTTPSLLQLSGIDVHLFKSYYTDATSRQAIVSDLASQVSRTALNCPVLPTVASIAPSSGPLAGGTNVTITGTNFTGVTEVTIGGNPLGNRAVVSATSITGTTPASSTTGTKNVVVTTSAGSGTCTGCFTYQTATLTKMSGDNQSGDVGQPLGYSILVKAADASGNPVPNQTVNWLVSQGGGWVNPASSVTDSLGLAGTTW
ncbi:MAG: IPT/TIG domain-containing protein, partial [Planctomycetota bacterium]|nr:IPT/TIG domain-containing protein [Planctomycetota bacterium]